MIFTSKHIVVIIPCKNEADNIEVVYEKLVKLNPRAIIIGLDPNSTDDTATVAKALSCIVVKAESGGYDPAVYAATKKAKELFRDCVFLYADAGNKYDYMHATKMLHEINNGSDIVLAVRADSANTMLWHQKIGTQLLLMIINLKFSSRIRDVSPFRMVRPEIFDTIEMSPKTFRWPSELLVKALALKVPIAQTEVVSLPRLGSSKVSGSLKNSLKAGFAMFSSLRFINYKGKGQRV